jgi:hypothetical protein
LATIIFDVVEHPVSHIESPDPGKFAFRPAIEALRAEHRTRPCQFDGRGAMFSVRQRTAISPDRKYPEPFDSRPEQFDGPVVPIWHKPDHLVFEKRPDETQDQFETRIYAKPRYTGEPDERQIARLVRKYTHGGQFKAKKRERFQKRRHKYLFKNHTDEAPAISQSFHPKELDLDSNNDFEDGAYVEEPETEQPGDCEQIIGFTPPKTGSAWCSDPSFGDDLNEMLPKGYARPRVYQSGGSFSLPDDLRLAPPRDLDRNTYLVIPAPERPCPSYLVPQTELKPARSCIGGGRSESGLMLGELAQAVTVGDERVCAEGEAILRDAGDYDREQHERLAHFYEYQFRYIHPEQLVRGIIYESVRSSTVSKIAADPQKEVAGRWDAAIRATFQVDQEQLPMGELTAADIVPPEGVYLMYQLNPNTPARVLPIIITPAIVLRGPDAIGEDGEPMWAVYGDDGEFLFLDGPPVSGIDEIHQNIREGVARMRTRKSEIEVRRDVREHLWCSNALIQYVRFFLRDGKLTWERS